MLAVAGGTAAAGTALGLALYPGTALLVALVVAVGVLAVKRPAAGFVVAVGLFAFEGTFKVRLSIEGLPAPLAVTALALDVGLAAAVLGLVLHSDRSLPGRLWRGARRFERAALILLGLWLVLSLVQVPVGGDLAAGVMGLRLAQGYFAVCVLGGVLLWSTGGLDRLWRGVLTGLGVVAGYAALRVAIGPSGGEKALALFGSDTPQEFGGAFRAVGSFSGAFGLASFLVPALVLSLALALTRSDLRIPAGVVCALCLVAILGSQVRAGLFGVVAGVAVVCALLLTERGAGKRRAVLVAACVTGLAVIVVGGVLVTGGASDETRERTRGLVFPTSDQSLQMRFDTWEHTVKEAIAEPLGSGLGTVGRASGRHDATYTDNSYLKVLREQGFLGALPFIAGLIVLSVALVVGLVGAGPSAHPAALGALGAVAAFLAMFMFAEYIEQPGKVLVWSLLGVAIGDLFLTRERAQR